MTLSRGSKIGLAAALVLMLVAGVAVLLRSTGPLNRTNASVQQSSWRHSLPQLTP